MLERSSLQAFIVCYGILLARGCNDPLGMESKKIINNQISAAGAISNSDPQNSRFNTGSGWCTIGGSDYDNGVFNPEYYLQVDLLTDHTISSIKLQGLKDSDAYSYGTKIRVQWSGNASTAFGYYKDKSGNVDLTTQNLKSNQAELLSFDPPLCGRYLRLLPLVNANPKCIRFEVFGCSGCFTNRETTKLPITNTKPLTTLNSSTPSTMTVSTLQKRTKPVGQKSGPDLELILILVVVLLVLVIVGIILFWQRARLCFCLTGKRKGTPKKKFHVEIEATYSVIKPKGEQERLSLIAVEHYKDQAKEDQNFETYSEVYAAPVIQRSSKSNLRKNNDAVDSSKMDNIYEPAVEYSQPDDNGLRCDREPIYAGSQIYENPYQTVTGSSLYADPELVERHGLATMPNFPRDALNYVEKIGEGQFGEVYICEVENLSDIVQSSKRFSATTGALTKVAVKILKAGMEKSVEMEFMKEANVMAKLEHMNVVQLIGVCCDEPKCMVVEYMENGDLMQFLQAADHDSCHGNGVRASRMTGDLLTVEALCYIAKQVASGMEYLSSQGVVHRDLATRNCLLGKALTVKIADFGMSRYLYSKLYYKIEGKATLPIRWMAPECLYFGKFTSKSDVWAFGVTVWETFMFASEQPYQLLSDQQVIENALLLLEDSRKPFRYLSKPEYCPEDVYSMLTKCWETQPSERPHFRELFHFFDNLSAVVVEVSI